MKKKIAKNDEIEKKQKELIERKKLTQPNQINLMILEGGIALPGIYGAPHNPKLESFKESVSYAPAPYQEDDSMFDSVFSEKFLAITSPYLVGKQNLDETVRRLDAEALKAAKRILE